MTEKKVNSLVAVLKNAQKNPKVAVSVTTKVQQAKAAKNQVTSNKPTKRSVGRGG
jgi:hypothetical protein